MVYRHLSKGTHVFRVRSVDPSGVSRAVETVKFTVGGKAS
jgi:hypothetical protein